MTNQQQQYQGLYYRWKEWSIATTTVTQLPELLEKEWYSSILIQHQQLLLLTVLLPFVWMYQLVSKVYNNYVDVIPSHTVTTMGCFSTWLHIHHPVRQNLTCCDVSSSMDTSTTDIVHDCNDDEHNNKYDILNYDKRHTQSSDCRTDEVTFTKFEKEEEKNDDTTSTTLIQILPPTTTTTKMKITYSITSFQQKRICECRIPFMISIGIVY